MPKKIRTFGDLMGFGMRTAVQKLEAPENAPEQLKELLQTVQEGCAEESESAPDTERTPRAGDDVPVSEAEVFDVEGVEL